VSDLYLGIISFFCFTLGAFFAGSETALIAANRIRLSYLSEKGNKRARMVLDFAEQPHHFMSCVLVGTNLAIIGCTTTFTAITTKHFGNSGSTLAIAVLVPLFLIFNEIVPKSIFLYYPSRAAMLSVLPLKAFSLLLYPVIRLFSLMWPAS
jgi:putative hemolysin